MQPKAIIWWHISGRFRAYVEALEGRLEWRVYLINTIKKSFESLIADVVNSTPVVDKKRQIYFAFLVFPSSGHLI